MPSYSKSVLIKKFLNALQRLVHGVRIVDAGGNIFRTLRAEKENIIKRRKIVAEQAGQTKKQPKHFEERHGVVFCIH